MAARIVPVKISVTDLEPVKRLITGAEKMRSYEQAGGDGWWEGWAEVCGALRELRTSDELISEDGNDV